MQAPNLERPQLSPWHRRARADTSLLLAYGSAVTELSGAAVDTLLPRLLPLLDGSRSVDEIVEVLGEPVRPAVERALSALASGGLLVEGGAGSALALHLASLSERPEPARIDTTLARARVRVLGDGTTAAAVARAVASCGVAVCSGSLGAAAEPADLTIVAPSPEELPLVRSWNERALDAGSEWLAVLPFDGLAAWVGPLFVPGETCCFECFRLRRAANLPCEDDWLRLDEVPAAFPLPDILDELFSAFAGLAVARRLAAADRLLLGAGYAFELGPIPAVARHVVYRVPRCPACAPAAAAAPVAVWGPE